MKEINERGPYKPNTIERIKPKDTIMGVMAENHVVCPDSVIRYGLSWDQAQELCFKFNLAYFKGREDALKELGKDSNDSKVL